MLVCVCQPTETALLLKGGPPVAMGLLGANSRKHIQTPEATKNVLYNTSSFTIDETKESSASLTSSPSLPTSGSLLNLRKIKRKAKSTKILVNPACTDSLGSSEDSTRPKKVDPKWKGKKKRLKGEEKQKHNSDDTKKECDWNEEVFRCEAKKDEKSISCFKMKSSEEKARPNEDHKSGKENCKNENSSNWSHCLEPDIIIDSRKNSKEIILDETADNTEVKSKSDQSSMEKTDSIRKSSPGFEVSLANSLSSLIPQLITMCCPHLYRDYVFINL